MQGKRDAGQALPIAHASRWCNSDRPIHRRFAGSLCIRLFWDAQLQEISIQTCNLYIHFWHHSAICGVMARRAIHITAPIRMDHLQYRYGVLPIFQICTKYLQLLEEMWVLINPFLQLQLSKRTKAFQGEPSPTSGQFTELVANLEDTTIWFSQETIYPHPIRPNPAINFGVVQLVQQCFPPP